MDQRQRAIDYLKEEGEFVQTSDGSRISASQMLERFLFPPDHQYVPIHKLSGGEKRRLFLLRVLMSAPNVLILDEPTNDLDVQTLAVLEDYLQEFNGCVLAVSHDRYFLDRTVNTLFVFEQDGSLRRYPGNYSTYMEFKRAEDLATEPSPNQSEKKPQGEPNTSNRSRSGSPDTKPRKLSFKEKRELDHLETQIPEMESQKAALEQRLYTDPPTDYQDLQLLTEQLAQLDLEIDRATERWMELSELPT